MPQRLWNSTASTPLTRFVNNYFVAKYNIPLGQGAGTLYTITSQLVKGGDIGKTLDMKVDVFVTL